MLQLVSKGWVRCSWGCISLECERKARDFGLLVCVGCLEEARVLLETWTMRKVRKGTETGGYGSRSPS